LKKLKFPFRSNKELALVHGMVSRSLLGGWFIADGWQTFLFQGKASCGLPAGQERRLSMRTKLTASERREATRLRSERWRRAHGREYRKRVADKASASLEV